MLIPWTAIPTLIFPFKRIESLVRKYLVQATAKESIVVSMHTKIQLTIEFKKKQNTNNKTSDNPIGLTCGYDMGWSKRSSEDRYDSTFGHVFLTGCHGKKYWLPK